MNAKSIIRIRNITLLLWLLFPVFLISIPKLIEVTGLKDWSGVFLLVYMILCCVFAYKLQKSICPDCNKYMFRGGKMKYAIQKFLFRQCGQCGFKL
jgi:hypothetical protein